MILNSVTKTETAFLLVLGVSNPPRQSRGLCKLKVDLPWREISPAAHWAGARHGLQVGRWAGRWGGSRAQRWVSRQAGRWTGRWPGGYAGGQSGGQTERQVDGETGGQAAAGAQDRAWEHARPSLTHSSCLATSHLIQEPLVFSPSGPPRSYNTPFFLIHTGWQSQGFPKKIPLLSRSSSWPCLSLKLSLHPCLSPAPLTPAAPRHPVAGQACPVCCQHIPGAQCNPTSPHPSPCPLTQVTSSD